MAIEKHLNSRLKLRYDSHENWITNDPVLYAGEVALSTISVQQEGTVNFVPSVLIKVGDGTHKYSELDFAYAKSADVLSACKSESSLKAFINSVIADADIASNEAMEALSSRVTKLEGNEDTDGSVAKAIKDAIDALDLANTYAAKEHGHTVSEISDFDEKVKAYDYATKSEAQSYADAKDGAIAEAKQAGLDATSALNTYKNEMVTVLAGKQDVIPENTYDAYGSASNALSEAKGYVDQKFTNANLAQYTTEDEVKSIVDGVIAGAADSDTYNSLTKLVDYIDSHGGEASEMAQAIDTLEGKVEVIEGKPAYDITATQISNWDNEVGAKTLASTKTTTAEVKAQIEAYGYATTGYADQSEQDAKDYTDNQIKALALGTMSKETAANYVKKSEAVGYGDILTKTDAQGLYQAKGNYASAEQGAKADSALQAITTTENGGLKVTNNNSIDIDDSIVFVFDCGGSGVTA